MDNLDPLPRHYVAFMLRIWNDADVESAQWRASLEDPRTGVRKGFTDVSEALNYIRDYIEVKELSDSQDSDFS